MGHGGHPQEEGLPASKPTHYLNSSDRPSHSRSSHYSGSRLIVLMFYAALRQSEVVAQTKGAFNPQRHLTRGDVAVSTDSVVITIKAAKNMQRYNRSKTVTVYKAQHAHLCLIKAIGDVVEYTPTKRSDQPMFVFHKTYQPISANYVCAQWPTGVISVGQEPHLYTLHGLYHGL